MKCFKVVLKSFSKDDLISYISSLIKQGMLLSDECLNELFMIKNSRLRKDVKRMYKDRDNLLDKLENQDERDFKILVEIAQLDNKINEKNKEINGIFLK